MFAADMLTGFIEARRMGRAMQLFTQDCGCRVWPPKINRKSNVSHEISQTTHLILLISTHMNRSGS